MCTLVLLHRPGADWPLLVAANRDERLDRAADPPGAWWPDQPDILGGRDRLAGGTWLALRGDGMLASVLNRADSLGPADGMRSRGWLPLTSLKAPTPGHAAAATLADARAYRPFNLVLADRSEAWFVAGGAAPWARQLDPGLHMITAADPNDSASPRIARHFPRLAAARPPTPPDWSGWAPILADQSGPPQSAMWIAEIDGFGTVSSCRVGLGRQGPPIFHHRDRTAESFQPVALPSAAGADGQGLQRPAGWSE